MSTPITEYKEVRCVFGGPDPGVPKLGEMFVFYDDKEPQGAEYLCPCGCGNSVYTPISSAEKPKDPHKWQYSNLKGPTISPSVRWICGCKAHFNITDGKVIIHGDSGH